MTLTPKGHTSMIRTIAVAAIAAGTIATVGGVAAADGQDKIAFCHNENNLHLVETSVQAFFNAGHIDHEGDIWAAFDYTENGKDGEVIHVQAQGDQAVLLNGCQPIVPTESPSPSPSPSDIPSSPPVTVTPTPTDTGSPSPSITPTPRETPEPPAPRYDEYEDAVLDCDNHTMTITSHLFEFLPFFNEDTWEWEYPAEGTALPPTTRVVDVYGDECEEESPSPNPSSTHTRSVPPTDSSTVTPPSTPDVTPTTVPVAAELAHTGADTLTPALWLGGALLAAGGVLYLTGRRRPTPTHR